MTHFLSLGSRASLTASPSSTKASAVMGQGACGQSNRSTGRWKNDVWASLDHRCPTRTAGGWIPIPGTTRSPSAPM